MRLSNVMIQMNRVFFFAVRKSKSIYRAYMQSISWKLSTQNFFSKIAGIIRKRSHLKPHCQMNGKLSEHVRIK